VRNERWRILVGDDAQRLDARVRQKSNFNANCNSKLEARDVARSLADTQSHALVGVALEDPIHRAIL
jgi:hypothetical protein